MPWHESITRLGIRRMRVTDCTAFRRVRVDCDSVHTGFAIESDGVHGDRRRAGASMADTDDRAVAIGLDDLPGFGSSLV